MFKQICCDRCDHIATNRKNLKRHMEDKHERGKYNCDACELTSTRQSLVWHHIKVKHEGFEELKHLRPQCDRIVTYKYSLQLHIQAKHERNDRIVYFCDHCGYESFSQNQINVHRKSTYGTTIFKCNMCTYQSYQKSILKSHKLSKHD